MLTDDYLKSMIRLVDQANKRLLRIERLAASDDTYKNIKEFAYKYAQEDIKRMRKPRPSTAAVEKRMFESLANFGKPTKKVAKSAQAAEKQGKVRYQRPPAKIPTDPKARRALEERLRRTEKSIQRFLDAPTSSVKQVKEIYSKRAKTFSAGFDKGAPPMSADELVKTFETGLWSMLMSTYGSETTRRIIGEIKRQRNELKRLQQQGKRIRLKSDSAGDTADKLNQILEANRGNVRILSRYLRNS